jgi:UDP-glucose 4-epimerase
MRTHLITGGAGFIGANLAQSLLNAGDRVVIFDNLSRGSRRNIEMLSSGAGAELVVVDISQHLSLDTAFEKVVASPGIDEVWHLAANSDIPAGVRDPNIDLRDTFLTTFNLLLAMKRYGIGTLHFASTSAVYGLQVTGAFSELDATLPISNYGAMKLASEAQIRAALESSLERVNVFRFPNVVGLPATHGVILDFVRKLQLNEATLDVLGNGTQRKPYLHVSELIEAMMFVREHSRESYSLYNMGPEDGGVLVSSIAEEVRNQFRPNASIAYGKEDFGWVGDVPHFSYSTAKLAELGWRPRYSSMHAIQRAVAEVVSQESSR